METNIRVYVRVRPLVGKEIYEKVGECVKVYNDKQIGLDERHFTFDKIFSKETSQVKKIYMCIFKI